MTYGPQSGPLRPQKSPTALDYLKALGPIALGIVAALNQKGIYLWALIALAALFLAVAFGGSAWRWLRRRRRRGHDDAIARRAVPYPSWPLGVRVGCP
jgi:hypothetical protein